MLKAIVSYSKKIPVPDSEYSSQGYSLSLETEVPESDPAAIQARLHDTFELVRSSVELELAHGNSGQATQQAQTVQAAQPARTQPPASHTGDRASNKQIKFLTDLTTQRGMSLADLNADVQRRFGVAGIYDLSRRDASALLDELNGKQRKAA